MKSSPHSQYDSAVMIRPCVWGACLASVSALSCADLTAPSPMAAAIEAAATASPTPTASAAPAPPPRPVNPQITASHVLIAYKGALRAEATRSKDQARALAAKVLERARKGEDFGELAAQFSDDPSAKSARGSLGSFTRESMVKPFSDAAFALQPGQIGDVVETDFGFHVIKRTE